MADDKHPRRIPWAWIAFWCSWAAVAVAHAFSGNPEPWLVLNFGSGGA